MIELKPCPFCGGEPYFLKPRHEKETAFDTMMIECKHCGALPYAVSVYDGKKEEDKKAAIAKFWNKRSNDWISVDDGLPEKGKLVIVAIYGSDIVICEDGETVSDAINRQMKSARGRVTMGFIGSDGWYNADGFPMICTPSFWSDLPEPPTLEGDE